MEPSITLQDDNLGRGGSIYLLVLIGLNLSSLIALSLMGTSTFAFITKETRLLELGALLFLLELMAYVVWSGVQSLGWGRLSLMLATTFILAFIAEASGVNYGMVFGSYYYSDALGFKVWGVPLLIALAWEPIIFASYRVAKFLLPAEFDEASSFLKKLISWFCLALIGALAATNWDMMMDPFAVFKGWWVWPDGGPYVPYVDGGVPISNFIGWIKVAFVCQLLIHFIYHRGTKPRQSVHLNVYGPLMLYFLLFMMAFGVSAILLRRPEVCLIGIMGMGMLTLVLAVKIFLLKYGFEQSWGIQWLQGKTQKG